VVTPNSTSNTINSLLRGDVPSFRSRTRINRPELEFTSLPKTDESNTNRRPTLKKTENTPNIQPFQSFQRFQPQRIRQRVERSVELFDDSLNSKTVIFHTRLNSAIRVI
jgi:hypothetical protein